MKKQPKNQEKQIDNLLKKTDIDELIKEMDKLSTDVEKIINKGINEELTVDKKKQLLVSVKNRVEQSDVKTRQWIVEGISTAYIDGMNITDKVLRSFKIETKAGEITFETLKTVVDLKPHLQAVNSLISDSYLDFAGSMNGVIKGTERMLNETIKKQVRSKIAVGRLSGDGIKEISEEITKTIGQQGFSVLIDRGGKKWSLDNYSRMLARTHIIKANNEAIINRAVEFGVDIVEVSSHGSTDLLCGSQEGKLYSISGESKNYPKLQNVPPFHPNCKHRLLLRPDLK